MKEDVKSKLLVTGGAGFIGSNFIHYIFGEHPEWTVTNLDSLTYAGNLENLKDVENDPRYKFVKGDITNRELVNQLVGQGVDVIVNFAAESHVDRSIMDASPFIRTNIEGTQVLLEAAREHSIKLFLQVSTDEVYGSLGSTGKFSEETSLAPNSPYSACKASADLLCRAYYHTHGLPIKITRCSNNYGPYQFPEKLIPLLVTNALENKEIPVYGDGMNVRDWIHTEDHCRALDFVIQHGKVGEVYNVGSDNEQTNLALVKAILDIMGKPHSLIKFVTDRAGHDLRYAIDNTKIESETGWKPRISFEEGLKNTVNWYVHNESWWRRIKSGEYADYYQQMYSQR